ncbi:MAG: tyrosine-type recombinase/integrase, partial [Parabacteroides sp.]|nr:tyrosine-type recombinase/integrase [Parabacteroides sp.]
IIPEVRALIDKYADAESDYLFPSLRENRRGEGEVSEKSALRRLNRGLEQVGKELRITQILTTYVARHTWASMVESCGMNTAVISQGLGHSSERVTRIYMKGMPSHVIDKANEEMLNQTVRLRRKRKKERGNLKNKEEGEKKKKCHLLSKKGTLHRIRLI